MPSPGDWTETTFNNLRTLDFRAVSAAFARKMDAFIARHRELTDIIISNCGPKALEDFPCVATLYKAVVERELSLHFRVECVHLVRGEEARKILGEDGEGEGGKGMPMCAKKVKIYIEDRTEDVISCIMENLPPCAEMSLNFDGDDGRDFSINKNLWSILLSNAPLLRSLTTLHLSLLFDDRDALNGTILPSLPYEVGKILLSDDTEAIKDLAVRLAPRIRALVDRCPKLGTVLLSQPIGYDEVQKFFEFTIVRGYGKGQRGGGYGEGESRIDCAIHGVSEWKEMSM
ncbi:uncharacterized protein STEHIDRAFT_107410 [Stereum hirsutum FP-91666 SS1]|uniref:uncharacterized protein n=1 Tax=Stereum hirsutum (strain FP-91666) TaxID=721885 RepID=UPI000440DC47|nr:uncharacterized protein STEHIDRAFT_107410 [Stereum hirsutum FP-91666 SS1]EIM90636.1 hypothetical protein STEHIDRAFT_107410 [Stereum hirsutum FP-91666 SS1]